jgi:N-acetylglutamate synthase-like GNAT family acetyltransferase
MINERCDVEIISINESNIDKEHICCAITEKKGETCVASKKAWMSGCFDDGLVFKRLDARGKAFIEYMPANTAWCPITADGYMHINCFWVSGQYSGQGWANKLLEECISDAKEKGMRGLTVISSAKKMPFLSDPKYLKYKGFKLADTAHPHFELLYLAFDDSAPEPKFKGCAKQGKIGESGLVLYYSNQCPHTDKYAPMIQKIASDRGAAMRLCKFESYEQAQNAPSPFTTYSLFRDGEFVTNEILSEKKFTKYLDDWGL